MQHKLTISASSSQAGSLSGTAAEAGSQEIVIDEFYGANQTNTLLTVNFTTASIQSVILVSDRGLVIRTNSTGSPGNTITLKPGIPLVWHVSAGYFANPFTANVTAFYITTTAAARLQMRLLKT